jgi:hypothetical protein
MHEEQGNLGAETAYWGVPCRTCKELVLFDTYPCNTFGITTATRRPGAIRCTMGHNHIYFPHDFRYWPSAIAIDEATMEHNRTEYLAINPASRLLSLERFSWAARRAS